MENAELRFLRKMLERAKRLGFQTSVETLTSLLGSQETRPHNEHDDHSRSGMVKHGRSSKLLTEYNFASSEESLVKALASQGIATRGDLKKALVKTGQKASYLHVKLTTLLKQEDFSADVARTRDNIAKAIYRLAGLPIPALEEPAIKIRTVSANHVRPFTKRSRPLAELPFAEGEPTLVAALAGIGIHSRADLVKALTERGRKRLSVETELVRLLKLKNFTAELAKGTQNVARSIYQLSELPIPVPQQPGIKTEIEDRQPIEATISAKIRNPKHTQGFSARSKPLGEFPFAQEEPALVTALASVGVHSRADLVKALTKLGRKRISVETELVRLLKLKNFTAELAKGTQNVARSIYQIAGLPIPVLSDPARGYSNITPSSIGRRVFKSRLLSSFPFAYQAPALIDGLASRGIRTRADLLAVMKKRKLDVSGVPKFLDGQFITSWGTKEGYSATAQAAAAIAKLSCDIAFGSGARDVQKMHPLSLPTEIAAQPVMQSKNPRFDGYRLSTLAPALTEALAQKGLASEVDLRSALTSAGVTKGKAAIAVEAFLNGSLLGVIQHQAGSTSVGRFFCDIAGVPFATTLAGIGKPPAVQNGHNGNHHADPLDSPHPGDICSTQASSPLSFPSNASQERTELKEGSAERNGAHAPATVVPATAVKSTVRGKANADPFDEGLLSAMPQLHGQARKLTRNNSAAEDLVQQTMARALTAQREHKGFVQPPDTPYQKALERWLHIIMRNAFVSGLRKGKPHLYESLVTDDEGNEGFLNLMSVPPRQDDIVEIQEVFAAIGKLSPDRKHTLLRVAFDGKNYDALADEFGTAIGTAKSRVFRSREQLREALDRPGKKISNIGKSLESG